MNRIIFLIIFLISQSNYSQASVSNFAFTNIPTATTVDESKEYLAERKKQIIQYFASQELGTSFQIDTHRRFNIPAIAKAYLGIDGNKISKIILSKDFKPFAKAGTNYTAIPGICQRKGDYDFALHHLVRLAFLHQRNNILSQDAYQKLLFTMLTEKGNKHYKYFSMGLCGVLKDTENHILMTETSRYLTNELLATYYKNNKLKLPKKLNNNINGFNNWMLEYLHELFVNYFNEYNSRPYQGYAIMPLLNLYSFSTNKKVKEASKMILDLLSTIFATQSNKGRRSVPFRRQITYEPLDSIIPGDGEIARHALLSGELSFYDGDQDSRVINYGTQFMVVSAISDYVIPDFILDLIIKTNHNSFFEILSHQTPEVYYSSPSFLVSAGGIHINRLDGATKQNDGWSRPTTLIPTYDNNHTLSSWFRFLGNKKRLHRKNTCVYKNFSCGLNFKEPNEIPNACKVKYGDWTFYNFDRPNCNLNYGFHLAVFSKKCDSWRCKKRASNFGLWEVREKSEISFSNFMKKIIVNNSDFYSKKVNTFNMSDGTKIKFKIMPFLHKTWEIISVNNKKVLRNFKKRKLFSGDIIKSIEQGKILISNPKLNKSLLLDFSNKLLPKRKVIIN